MPPKKNTSVQKAAADGGPVLPEGSDPVQTAVAIIDKKVRNLEKRKNKLLTLQESAEQGERLKRDQEEAIAKLGEVQLQLDLVRELQKQFTSLNVEYEKSRKRQQKLAKQQARDTERDAQKRAVLYTLRVQDMLNSMGDVDKENFRAGSNGAVKLSDEDLGRLDELYKLLTPTRADNFSYKTELDAAGESLILMMEQSSKEVMGTTYKQLNVLMQSVDECGYFDQQQENEEEEEEEEEQDEDQDDYKSADDQVTSTIEETAAESVDYSEEAGLPVEEAVRGEPASEEPHFMTMNTETGIMPDSEITQHSVMVAPPSVITQSSMMSYMPSAPSPQFPGLAASPLQHNTEEGFSFMHESEVDRSQGFQQPQATLSSAPITTSQVTQAPQTITPPPAQDYSQFTGGTIPQSQQESIQLLSENGQVDAMLTDHSGGENQTDVATGQANPAIDGQLQGTVETLPGSGATYNQDSYQRQSRNPPNNRGWQQQGGSGGQGRRAGGGGGGGWANQQKGGRINRNGQNYQGGGGGRYEGIQGGYQNSSRNYQGGGYQGKSGGGGRPNYRTGGGGPRR